MVFKLQHHLKLGVPQYSGLSFVALQKASPANIKLKDGTVICDEHIFRYSDVNLVATKQTQSLLQGAAHDIYFSMCQSTCKAISVFEPLVIDKMKIQNTQIFSLQFLFTLKSYKRLAFKIVCFKEGARFNVTTKPRREKLAFDIS